MNVFTMRVNGVKHWDYLSSDHKLAIAFGRTNKRHSFHTRQKISRSLKGQGKSRSHRYRISRSLKDHTVRELTRGKMSAAARSRNFIIISRPGRQVTR